MNNNKIKIIIIDDEPLICELICRLVEWDTMEVELTGIANDGIRALELLKQHRPEIAIIDIRIPEIDGIAVMKYANDLGLPTRFIVISGYKKFEYAQQALCLNVSNYLVKPINKKELLDSIIHLCAEINESKKKSNFADKLQTQLVTQRHVMYDSLLSNLNNKSWCFDNIDDANNKLSLRLCPGKFRIFIIKLDMRFVELGQSKMLLDHIEQIFDHSNFKDCFEFGVHRQNDTRLVFLGNYPNESSSAFHNCIDITAKRALNYISAYDSCNITIGVSGETDSLSTLPERYLEAVSAVEHRRTVGANNIIYYFSNIPHIPISNVLDNQNIKLLSAAIGGLDPQMLTRAIKTIFSIENSSLFDQHTFVLATSVVHTFFELLGSLGFQSNNFLNDKAELLFLLDNEIRQSVIENELENKLPTVLKDFIESCMSWDDKYVTVAKGYIKDGYSSAITLEDVAQIVHLNPVYFSTLFKSKTGTTFTNYLQEVRIEASKNFFKTTRHSVKEVCKMVGYSDVQYFTKLFKKEIGVTPSSFRKLYMSADSFT